MWVYKLYQPNELNCHFVVICPENNVSHLRLTANALKSNGYNVTAILDETASAATATAAAAVCPTKIAGKTITSLLNVGLKNGGAEWNVVTIAGTWVRPNLVKKMGYFVESDWDVLFPVVDRQFTFPKGTINGLTMHRKVFEAVGPFDEINPLETCKTLWWMDAVQKGVTFKAVVGARMG